MCAHGCVACWGSGRVPCTSWTGLCLVGWCSATPGMNRVCWAPAGSLGHNLPCAGTGNGTTPAGQMSSLMVLGIFTQEDVCLWAEQWLIACPRAAPVLMETQLSLLLRTSWCSQGAWQTGLPLPLITRRTLCCINGRAANKSMIVWKDAKGF